jgi:predicted transcriptional regulator
MRLDTLTATVPDVRAVSCAIPGCPETHSNEALCDEHAASAARALDHDLTCKCADCGTYQSATKALMLRTDLSVYRLREVWERSSDYVAPEPAEVQS